METENQPCVSVFPVTVYEIRPHTRRLLSFYSESKLIRNMSHNIRERKGRTDKPDRLSDSKTYTFLLYTEICHFFVRTHVFRPRNVARGLLDDEVMFVVYTFTLIKKG